MGKLNGIWHGKNASAAVVDEFSIVFLRLEKKVIAAVLRDFEYGTVDVVYGLGEKNDAKAVYRFVDPISGEIHCNDKDDERLLLHRSDTMECEDGKLIYTMYDGKRFELLSAEKLDEGYFEHKDDGSAVSAAEKMAKWNVNLFFSVCDGRFSAGIDTLKYSFYFSLDESRNFLYCRAGQNGYCDKGWAMLSTTCIRMNECRMIEDNLKALEEYKPNEDWFVVDGCSFPEDGGWYWSLREMTDTAAYLNGCGDATYTIEKPQK